MCSHTNKHTWVWCVCVCKHKHTDTGTHMHVCTYSARPKPKQAILKQSSRWVIELCNINNKELIIWEDTQRKTIAWLRKSDSRNTHYDQLSGLLTPWRTCWEGFSADLALKSPEPQIDGFLFVSQVIPFLFFLHERKKKMRGSLFFKNGGNLGLKTMISKL